MAIERRLTEIVGPVGGKLHTARSRNDQVATDMAMFTRAHALGDASSACSALQSALVAARRAPPRLADARLHAPPARAAGLPLATTCSRTSGCSGATRARFELVLGATDDLPLGAGALAGVNFDTDRAAGRRASSASPASRRTRSTRSPTATSCSTTSPRRRPARRTSRGWARRSCCGRARSSASARCPTRGRRAPRSCRRRRTPTRPSCCAPRRRASPPTWSALHGVLHGLPLTYNKDMQEDKEHLFDAVDTLDLCLAGGAPGCSRASRSTASGWPRAAADELIAATDVADLLVRRGRAVPAVARHRRRARARGASTRGRTLSELTREELARHSDGARRRVLRRCSRSARGSSPRSPRAARRSAACASSSRTRGPSSTASRLERGPLDAAFYDRPVLEVAPRPARLHGRATATTAGVIVETEAYHDSEPACHAFVGLTRAHARRCSGRRAARTCTAPTASTRCSTRSASPEGVGAAVLIRALEPLDGLELMRARRGLERARGPLLGPGQAHPGAGDRARARTAPTSPRPDRVRAAPPRWREPAVVDRRRGSGSPRRPSCPGASARRARCVSRRGLGRRRAASRAALAARPAAPRRRAAPVPPRAAARRRRPRSAAARGRLAGRRRRARAASVAAPGLARLRPVPPVGAGASVRRRRCGAGRRRRAGGGRRRRACVPGAVGRAVAASGARSVACARSSRPRA